MSPTLQQFEFFRAVARNLSFSQAAKELYTSQPYVSNQIRRLESHYDVPLFVRSQPQIALTEAGRALYERIEDILDDVARLDQLAQQFQGLRRGSVRLAATASAGNHVIPRLITSFNRDHPGIVITAMVGNTGDVVDWLGVDEVELGISPRRCDSRTLVSEELYREPLVVICPADMDLPEPLTPEHLARLPKVAREEGSGTLARMRELLSPYPAGTEFVAQLSGTTAVNQAVASGLGVSLVPEYSAGAWLDAGAVRRRTLAGVCAHHTFYLTYARGRYLTPATRAFVTHLRHNLAEGAASAA